MWPFTRAYPELRAEQVDGQTFDYIIVGGGTAGCVLASRLSEDPGVSVLLLEKGRVRDNVLSRMPLMSQNFFLPWLQVVKDRYSEPIEACDGKKTQLWGAEALGGGSRINVMLVTRGLPGGYNGWAEMGLTDWSWEKVEPYFRKMETAKGHPGKPYRGHGGPLENRQFAPPFKFYPYMETACTALGLPVEQDCNSPHASAQGYFHLDVAIDSRGQRVSTYRAYLDRQTALERRDHLSICTGVVASRLQVDEGTLQVTGVHIRPVKHQEGAGGRDDFLVRARREVIVCNGAFRSPQLLMLSGIGSREQLDAQGIPCVHELPAVGANLCDHYSVPIMMDFPVHETLHRLSNALFAIWHLLLYFIFGSGRMAAPSNQTTIFVRTSSLDEKSMTVRATDTNPAEGAAQTLDNMDASQSRNIPDVEIMLNPVNCVNVDTAARPCFTLYTTLVQPFSRGRVELASADPLAHPRVHYPMFTDERDWAPMRTATRLAMKLAEEFAASGYPYPTPLSFAPGMDATELRLLTRGGAAPLSPEPAASGPAPVPTAAAPPRPAAADLRKLRLEPVDRTWQTVTDDEIDAFARRVGITSLHFSCTCRMSADARDGVVDQRLRVHGLRNLRVADTSVFPTIPSAHTMAAAIMVAERCADFLKEDWAERKTK